MATGHGFYPRRRKAAECGEPLTGDDEIGIEGVRLIPLSPHHDERGSFVEIYRHEWLHQPDQVVQANLSISREGVLRGLHFHRRQRDYWCVVSGTAFIGLYDLRVGSPTEGSKAELPIREVRSDLGYSFPRVAHGLFAETTTMLLYLVDAYFTGEDELGVAWDDPQVGIRWPRSDPIVSGAGPIQPLVDPTRGQRSAVPRRMIGLERRRPSQSSAVSPRASRDLDTR